jgi:hypothetical protein
MSTSRPFNPPCKPGVRLELDAVLEPTEKAVIDMKVRLDEAGITNQDAARRQTAGQAFYNTSPFSLREYRERLIADAVTGGLDVRTVAASLPEQADGPELVGAGDTDPDDDVEDDDFELEEAAA